jgi:hypothetical protein
MADLHILTEFSDDFPQIIIQFAIEHFRRLCWNQAGRNCIEECLANAKKGERRDLENTIYNRMTDLAMGRYR